ncbi:hypothetical protein [Pseudomonas sp. NFACC07-1]|uniref:hypothetical protein n=1 Tax=Pseudomonas sp. NFACC07-1 TaxID=1566239 RepID=UPI0008C9F678|nr:hypothetical protein [Pseudomonas sp. NFACC07-1]SEJ91387.1 hypothetical protein SAMN03159298_05045 [Pseudomonas sp. NFACC07-1]
MSASFNEGLVERSYHAIWERHFARLHGRQVYETFVPGKEEVYVGFDLGFAGPDPAYKFGKCEFFEWIKWRIRNTGATDSAFLFAYFYQYKLISSVNLSKLRVTSVKSGLITAGYDPVGKPYRAKLDTVRKLYAKGTKQHQFSQHEALCRLSRVKDAEVFYCTPKFDESMGIPSETNRKLKDLTRTPVTLSTPDFAHSSPHHLFFEDVMGINPMWCSEPIAAEPGGEISAPALLTPEQFIKFVKANYMLDESGSKVDYNEIKITEKDLERNIFIKYLDALPDCGRIVAVSNE